MGLVSSEVDDFETLVFSGVQSDFNGSSWSPVKLLGQP